MFGKIVKRKSDYSQSFVKSITCPRDLSHIPCVQFGRENEGKVAEMYKEEMEKEGRKVELFEVGLCVNPALPHLGASMDRGVLDTSCQECYGGLEVKTSPKAGSLGLSIYEAVDHSQVKGHFFLQRGTDDKITLSHDHEYYYQVLGQLALTGLPWVDFVAFSGVGGIHKERIVLNKSLWENVILPKLDAFYKTFMCEPGQ